MPAPPSTAVKAANDRAIAAAKATSTATRSSAPNAAAAAASARAASGNLGKSTPSGVGNQFGGGRTSAPTSTFSRNTVNAAAANASRMAAQRQAGVTQSYGAGKTGLGGANQTFDKGVNLSSGDLMRGGYGSYQQSSGRPSGLAALGGLQTATARMNPSVSSIVAGDPQARFGNVSTNGEIGAMMGPAGEGVFNRAMQAMLPKAPKDQSRVPSAPSPTATRTAAAGYQDYNPLSSVSAPSPVASPGYANPARAYPSRPAATPQVAGYDPLSSVSRPPERPVTVADVPQLPGGASTVRPGVTPSMGDWTQTFNTREPGAYDPANPQVQVAGYQNPARAYPSRATPQGGTTFTQALLDKGFTGQGLSSLGEPSPASAPRISLSSPNAAAQRAWNIQRARDTAPPAVADTSIYGDTPTTQTIPQRIAAALTGGPKGTPRTNPNARDPNNNSGEKIRQLVAAAQAGDPQAQEELKKWFIWNQWGTGPRPATV